MGEPGQCSRVKRRRQMEASSDSYEVGSCPQADELGLVDDSIHSAKRPTAAQLAAWEAAELREKLRPRLASELFVSQRGEVTQAEVDSALAKAKEFQATLTRVSTSILFVMDETAVYRTFYLDFQRKGDIAWQYMPLKAKPVKMVDPNMLAWTCGWNADQERITGPGWYHFALHNCLEEHDALVLEILHDTNKYMKIQVHVFRVAPVPPGCTGWKRHTGRVRSWTPPFPLARFAPEALLQAHTPLVQPFVYARSSAEASAWTQPLLLIARDLHLQFGVSVNEPVL